MKNFEYKGKFSGDERDLPMREHPIGAVKFKEHENMKELSRYLSVASIFALAIMFLIMALRVRADYQTYAGALAYVFDTKACIIGGALALICSVPHEFIHAIAFPGDVYMFQNIRQGMLFVIGPDDMSKGRFVFISMLPNVILGLIPFSIYLFDPTLLTVGLFGAVSISMGVGDYYNVYNTLRQMPGESMSYFYGMHSFWYFPIIEYIVPYESTDLVRTWYTTQTGEKLQAETHINDGKIVFNAPKKADYEIEEIPLKDAKKSLNFNVNVDKKSRKKVSLHVSNSLESNEILTQMSELGYSVKYKFYGSKKSGKKFKKIDRILKVKDKKYYFKAKALIYDRDGNLVTKTSLDQCETAKYKAKKHIK